MKYLKLTIYFIAMLIIIIGAKPVFSKTGNLQQFIVTNFPKIQKTEEQNKDGSGNIKVHEQGVTDVNIVNSTPIPVQFPVTPAQEKKWEYLVECYGAGAYGTDLQNRLNNRGNAGWELLQVVVLGNGNTDCDYYKRPVQQ